MIESKNSSIIHDATSYILSCLDYAVQTQRNGYPTTSHCLSSQWHTARDETHAPPFLRQKISGSTGWVSNMRQGMVISYDAGLQIIRDSYDSPISR